MLLLQLCGNRIFSIEYSRSCAFVLWLFIPKPQPNNATRRPMWKTDIHARSCFQKWKLKPNRTAGIVATLLGLLKPVMVTNKDVCLNLPVAIRQVIVLVVAIGSGTDA